MDENNKVQKQHFYFRTVDIHFRTVQIVIQCCVSHFKDWRTVNFEDSAIIPFSSVLLRFNLHNRKWTSILASNAEFMRAYSPFQLNSIGNDGTCDHSWRTMLSGNAAHDGSRTEVKKVSLEPCL